MGKSPIFAIAISAVLVASCQTVTTKPVENEAGTVTTYHDIQTRGPVSGVGIEGQDIVSMTDAMVRDMLGVPQLAGADTVPRVIIDAEYFNNESSQRLNKNQIVERLRIGLQRAAQGRIAFVNRARADMVAKERALKRAGKVDVATTGLTRAQAGADYRMSGRIMSMDLRNNQGAVQRDTMISFEMTDLETSLIVWSNMYEFRKAGQDDAAYR